MGLLENKGKVMWQSGGIGLSSASDPLIFFSEYSDILSKAYLSPGRHLSGTVLGCIGTSRLAHHGGSCPTLQNGEKDQRQSKTSICSRVAFCTTLLINRIMCFRMSHMASLCVCLVSCTYHWPIPVLRALHLAAYGLNLGYLLKPCVSY